MVASANKQTAKVHSGKQDVRGFWRMDAMGELDLAAKTVAWYCLQGPQTVGPGMFVLVPEQAMRDLKVSQEDWNFYLELVVAELGWKWDEQRKVLWITDWFRWQPVVGKKELKEMLGTLTLLPQTAWVEELAQQPPAELSPALQAVWTNWFFPAPPVETPPETSTVEVEEPAELTPEMIPVIVRLWFRPRTPSYVQRWVQQALKFHVEYLRSLDPNSTCKLPQARSSPAEQARPSFN